MAHNLEEAAARSKQPSLQARDPSKMAPVKNKDGSKVSKSKKKGSSKSDAAVYEKFFQADAENKKLKARNTELLRQVDQLQVDKAELKSKLEIEQKKNGEILSAGGEQQQLTESMVKTVNQLVQTKLFLYMPHLDKTMFHEANLAAPVTKALNIKDCDVAKYIVDMRRVTIEKTRYWRDYCGNDVKKAYISKCGSRIGCSV